ncbi:MAG: hypothetical protein ACLPPV_24565 [Candidatus Korobacteraceae bacterium]|jgi:hypothetical protein
MHRKSICLLLLTASLLLVASFAFAQNNPCNVMSLGPMGSFNGFVPFPSNSLWNTNISNSQVDPNSANYISEIGNNTPLHPDFGAGLYDGQTIGIPYIVVPTTQPLLNIIYTLYGDESDPGPMPIPSNALIEGFPQPGNGDRHVLIVDKGNCWLYELYYAFNAGPLGWNAGSGAVWDLEANEMRPYTWTSADAAGLPILPGLVRADEVQAGAINHAIRVTLQNSQEAFTPPASHWAPNSDDQYAAPMGMRLRLKASFNISGFSHTNQVILTALKQYGAIMADNGSSMFLTGTPDMRWNNDDLGNLHSVTASDFEVVLISPLYTPQNVPTGPDPTINSFTATSSGGSGQPVTLNWSVTNGEYYVVSPAVGAIRGNNVTVYPTVTTTYTLYATNEYGQTTGQVRVTVP